MLKYNMHEFLNHSEKPQLTIRLLKLKMNGMKMLHCFASFFLIFTVKNAFSAQFSVTISPILLWRRFQHKNIIL